jgi:hypothetical protein
LDSEWNWRHKKNKTYNVNGIISDFPDRL